MTNDSDTYAEISVNVLFATAAAIKVERNDLSEDVWIPRSVLFGPQESEIFTGNIREKMDLKVRQWFLRKIGLL